MERDFSLFPDDAHGNGLWEMLLSGDDLAQTREIQFSVIFASKEQALKFGQLLLENNQKLSFCPYPENEQFPWEITAYPEMSASYDNITAYIGLLESSAEHFQGLFDGWYSSTT